jgi:hypothetical protein
MPPPCPVAGQTARQASQSTVSRLMNAPSRTEAVRLTSALVEQACETVKPSKQETGAGKADAGHVTIGQVNHDRVTPCAT